MSASSMDNAWRWIDIAPKHRRLASKLERRLAVVAFLCSSVACVPKEGRVAIKFTWDSEPPPSSARSNYDLHVAIEERTEVERPGRVLQTATVKLADSAPLVLGQVPNGDNRVAVIEVMEVGASTLVRYFGLSEKFSLHAGDQKTVGVHLQLRHVPRFDAGVSVSIEGASAGRIRQRDVVVRVRAYDAHRILLGKDPNFTIGVSEADARSSKVQDSTVAPGLVVYDVPYDLNAGFDCRAGECADGLRAIYAKVLNAQDYASEVVSTRVELDTTGPTVIPRSVSIVLIPSPRNVLRSVTRVRDGTLARINFTLSKLAREQPLVVLTNGASALPFTLTASSGPSFLYEYLASGMEAEGSYGASVTATDLAGNTRTSTFALPGQGIEIDRTPPEAPDPARLVYRRVPWGSEATHGLASFSITSIVGAVEARATVIAYDGSATSSASEINQQRSIADSRGRFAKLDLTRSDRTQVYVDAVDEAGNESPTTLVREAEWVATYGRKVSGSRSPNPHRLETTPVVSDALSGPGSFLSEPTSAETALVTRPHEDQRRFAAVGGETWGRAVPLGAPPARRASSMVYDAARGRVVLFGGSGDPSLQDTWEWDGSDWTQRSPASSPPPRVLHAMAYDAARGRIVLFGGSTSLTWLDGRKDTWEWDGSDWIPRAPASSPPSRYGHAMAYDAARGRVVLFGGDGGGLPLQDTWEWDGSNWAQRSPTSSLPARYGHAMAYDEARGRIVLFGGNVDLHGHLLQDTWEWDGSNWTQRSPASSPSPRRQHAMVYDLAQGCVVLFGGFGGMGDLQATWKWDGSNWNQRSTASSPPPRRYHATAYDGAHGHVVVFGGRTGATDLRDTWEWDGSDWTQRSPASSPPARYAHAVAYDAARLRVVLYGGDDGYSDTFLQDTWEWDGSSWIRRSPMSSPPARSRHAMAYDEARGRTVLFGGTAGRGGPVLQDTWEWDGSNWIRRSPISSPPARYGHAMAYDAVQLRVVLFGGSSGGGPDLRDTWEWDGSNWAQRSPTSSPPARYGHAMAYDDARGRIVLFGGNIDRPGHLLQDTWEWDGSNWTQRFPASSPPVRSGHAMAYDAAQGRIVLSGGSADDESGPDSQDTWEWDGSSWSHRPRQRSATGRFDHAMAYEIAGRRVLLFGGFDANSRALNDTFVYSTDLRPGIVASFDWSSTGVSTTAVDRVSLSATFGGRGYTIVVPGTGTAVPGAEMHRWDAYAGQWAPAGPPNPADSSAPAPLTYASRVRSEAQRLIDSNHEMHFRFRPTRGSGNGPNAEVDLDYVELTVHYAIGSGDHPVCGNGKVELSNRELCDDGNTADGDGCSSDCNVEHGWSCSGEPSLCTVCGNGIVEGAEECDDGNLINGDGCNDACVIEPGWMCMGARSVCSMRP